MSLVEDVLERLGHLGRHDRRLELAEHAVAGAHDLQVVALRQGVDERLRRVRADQGRALQHSLEAFRGQGVLGAQETVQTDQQHHPFAVRAIDPVDLPQPGLVLVDREGLEVVLSDAEPSLELGHGRVYPATPVRLWIEPREHAVGQVVPERLRVTAPPPVVDRRREGDEPIVALGVRLLAQEVHHRIAAV